VRRQRGGRLDDPAAHGTDALELDLDLVARTDDGRSRRRAGEDHVAALGIPTYFQIPNAASLWLKHIPLDVDVPITCAGTLVMPGDVVVGDAEGVVILPAHMAEEIAHDAVEQEDREAWALERVKDGESIRGVYPLSAERRPEYERWRADRG